MTWPAAVDGLQVAQAAAVREAKRRDTPGRLTIHDYPDEADPAGRRANRHARYLALSTRPDQSAKDANEHYNRTRPPLPAPMTSDHSAADREDPDNAKMILRAANSFDGHDHEMSAAAFDLHIMAIAHATANDRPGFVPDWSLRSLTGEALRSLGAEPATLAAELCTAGMWERSGGGYRILDGRAVRLCMEHVRERREHDKRAPAREPWQHAANRGAPGPGGREAGQVAVTGTTRLGERIGQAAAASFRCAACVRWPPS